MALYDDVARQASKLNYEEQLRLIAYLAEQARRSRPKPPSRRHWRDIRGAVAYPVLSEDAQVWVSRQRQSNDVARSQQWDQES